MNAEELPWLSEPRSRIERLIHAERLPHGLLIDGPSGLGKSLLAHWLAARLLCEEDADGACGDCRGCRLVAAGSHPDLHRPLASGERRTTLGIDAVRGLGEFLSLSSQYHGARVAVIDPAEALTIAAANGLLKVLEEPPSEAFLILVASGLRRLPATVRSRCQRLPVAIPSAGTARAWLGERTPAAIPLLGYAGGAPLAAQALAANGAAERISALAEALRAIAAGERSPVAVATDWQDRPANDLLPWLQHLVFQIVRQRERRDETQCAVRLPPSAVTSSGLMRYLGEITSRVRAAEQPLNATLLAEDVFIGWARLFDPGWARDKGDW